MDGKVVVSNARLNDVVGQVVSIDPHEVVVLPRPLISQSIKRDGRIVSFDQSKITDAIYKAAVAVGGHNWELAELLSNKVVKFLEEKFDGHTIPAVEDIQDVVEKILIESGHAKTAKAYIIYRQKRTDIREAKSTLLDAVAEIEKETNRENANIGRSPSAKMLQIATAASRSFYLNRIVPEDFSKAHQSGAIHVHDLDYYGKTLNCLQIDLGDLFKKGFDTGHGYIRPPKRVGSAAAQAAIILQSNQNDMYGGQSFPHFDKAFAEFLKEKPASDDKVFQAMEGLIYNLNSMHSRAGAQVPFSSINLGTDTSKEGRQVISAILDAYYNGLGYGEQPIFPNIVFRLKKGINLDSCDPNYDLFKKALKVTGKRMFPAYSFMDSSFNAPFGDEASYMGCRTRVVSNRHGPSVSAKRGNVAFTTINLPRIALEQRKSSKNGKLDINKYYNDLKNMVELVGKQLMHRYEILSRLIVADVPFLMGQNLYLDSENLGPNDSIEKVMKHGTLSVGFVGLAEALMLLCGSHHGESDSAQELGISIISKMRDICDDLSEKYDKNFSLLATPAEQVAGRIIKFDKNIFGVIENITDRDYYTNSFHVPVWHEMSIFDKIKIEGPYHKYTNAGHISYVELPSAPERNIEALEKIIKSMSDSDIGYGAINFPIDECLSCYLQGVINQDTCPECGSSDIRRIRRITGYFSTLDMFNDGKRAELKDRVIHE